MSVSIKNGQLTWDLSKYEGAGEKVIEDGKVIKVVLTVEQQRQCDKEYRQFLINQGKLVPFNKSKLN